MTAYDDDSYESTVRSISDAIVDAQGPVRILNAIKWDDDIRDTFFASKCREQPAVDADWYAGRDLGFDLEATRDRFLDIELQINGTLGTTSGVAQLLKRTCEQYRLTLDLLEARGTETFGSISAQLYGTTDDVFHAGGPTVADLAGQFREALSWVSDLPIDDRDEKTINGDDAVKLLQEKLDQSMGPGMVDVAADDGIVADAAAGSSYIKLRADAMFSERQLEQLESHEGWVHVGTSANGIAQPICTFLGKAPPPVNVTQEGLATLTEILSLTSHPARLLRIADRIDAIALANSGATFVDVVEHFRTEGMDEDLCWQTAMRVFRGSTPTGLPFTKDLGYGKGLVLTYAYMRVAIRSGRLDRIPVLFCGKVDINNMGAINDLYDEGLIEPPGFLPEVFRDVNALAAQVAFSRFLRDLDFDRLAADYAPLLGGPVSVDVDVDDT
ncbi:flavohemoglobin expression-modulating QEGLA motif protein [Actinospongicola halichondriae]|uniref:flavohemoglobin expression-modulating QEGLA motif protein n=1 Tax=Actinospongicola halichondriae TaxID=3236844 RepID=UPI003D49FB8C